MSERPDTAALLAEVSDFVRRNVVLQGDHFYDAIALWILHAHAIGAFETSPRLLVKSPEKESGKTRLLEVLEVLVPNPLFVVNTTISVIFRLLATKQLTLLHDEVDAVFSVKAAPQNEDLRAILNSGYRRGAVVARAEREGKHSVREFPVFAATALAAIGNLPETVDPHVRRAVRPDAERFATWGAASPTRAIDRGRRSCESSKGTQGIGRSRATRPSSTTGSARCCGIGRREPIATAIAGPRTSLSRASMCSTGGPARSPA